MFGSRDGRSRYRSPMKSGRQYVCAQIAFDAGLRDAEVEAALAAYHQSVAITGRLF